LNGHVIVREVTIWIISALKPLTGDYCDAPPQGPEPAQNRPKTGARRGAMKLRTPALVAVGAGLGAAALVGALASPASADLTAKSDRTFSGDGVATLNHRGEDFSFAVVPDGDDYYLVGGTKNSRNADCAFMVARYDGDGRLVPSFGNRGVKTLTVGDSSCATDATLTPDGHLLVVGWSTNRRGDSAVLVQFHANGSIDRTFGDNGVVRRPVHGGISYPQLEVEPDGSIWLAWGAIRNWDAYTGNYQIAHLRPSGTPDRTFGRRAGVKTFNVDAVDELATTAVDDNGRFIVAGWSARSLDAPGKAVVLSVDDGEPSYTRTIDQWSAGTYPISADTTSTGQIVVGTTPTTKPGWGAVRLDESLRLDSTFSGDGKAQHRCECASHTGALTPDGELVLVGVVGRSARTVLAGFTEQGRWDSELAHFGPWNVADGVEVWWDADIDQSGRLMVAGEVEPRSYDAALARITLS
jgi:uncharacterized delta-60 repeat protein